MKNKNKIIGAIVAVIVIAVGYVILSGKGTLLTGKITLKPSVCPGPYHVQTKEGRCVWSCGVGTQPDNPKNSAGQCVCQLGYVESGTDDFGRRVCNIPTPPPPTPPPAISRRTSLPAGIGAPLSVSGGVVSGHCISSCVRGSIDDILTLTFVGQSGINIFRPESDSITLSFQGSLATSYIGIPDLSVRMVDELNILRGIGDINISATDPTRASVIIKPTSEIRIGVGDTRTYKFRIDSSSLLMTDTVRAETLQVLVQGNLAFVPSDILYYNDELGDMGVISGPETIIVSYAY